MWSISAAHDALARHQFIKISSVDPAVMITIQDVPNLWGEDFTFVIHTKYRIAGPAALVKDTLSQLFPTEQVEAVMESMITRDNYTTSMAEFYKLEQDEFTTWNRNITVYQSNIPGQMNLFNLARQINPAVALEVVGKVEKKKGASKRSLAERLAKLGPGRILDVSDLQEDGTGGKSIAIPKSTGFKFYVAGMPLISNDLDHYLRALSQLPGGYSSHLGEIEVLNRHNAALAAMQGIQPISLFSVLNLPEPSPQPAQQAALVAPRSPISQGISSVPTGQSRVFAPTVHVNNFPKIQTSMPSTFFPQAGQAQNFSNFTPYQ